MAERSRLLLVFVLALAVALRLAFVLRLPPLPLYWDEVHYHAAARIYAGAWQSFFGAAPSGPTLLQAFERSLQKGETYSATVGLIYAGFGLHPRTVFLFQALLDTATCFLVYQLARSLGGTGVGLLALGLATGYEPFIFSAARLQTETMAAFLYMAGLVAICGGGSWLAARHFAGGVLLALAMLAKPALQFLFPVLLPLVAARSWDHAPRRWMLSTLAFALGFFVLIGPRLLLTTTVTGRPLWSGDLDPGADIYGGAVIENVGWKTDRLSFAFPPRGEFLAVLGNDPTRRPTLADFRKAAWRTWLNHPIDSAAVMLHKLYRAWLHPYNDSRQSFLLGLDGQRRWQQLLLMLGIVGLPLALRAWRVGLPLVIVSIYLWATYLLVKIEVRYAVTVMPLMLCFAALAVGAVVAGCRRAWRTGQARPLLMLAVSALAGIGLLKVLSLGRLLQLSALLTPEVAHAVRVGGTLLVMVLIAYVLVEVVHHQAWSVSAQQRRLGPAMLVAGPLVLAVLILMVGRPRGDSWRKWQCPLSAGRGVVRHDFSLPAGLQTPQGVQLKLDLLPGPGVGCDVVVRANGEEVKRYRGGLKRKDADLPTERYYTDVFAAQRQENEPARAWYVVPVAGQAISPGGQLRVEIEVEGPSTDAPAVTLYGDYSAGEPVYDGPSLLSPHLLADTSLYKYLAEGDFRMRRRVPLAGSAHSSFQDGHGWSETELSPEEGRQQGRYRIFLVLSYPDGQVIIL